MDYRSEFHSWRRGTGALALTILLAGAGLIAAVAIMAALGAMPAYAQSSTPCDSAGSPVTVHYEVAVGSYPGVTSGFAVSGVVLSDFPGSCDGVAVQLQMWGNSAGDPSVALSADTLLSTADSTLDPCTQDSLTAPLVVAANGSITLPLCATGGPAGYVSVHDLTQLSLFLSAPTGAVSGISTASPAPATTSPAAAGAVLGSSVVTPVTGSGSSLSSNLLGVGIGLLIIGAFAIAGAARRRHPTV
jgi:hypothetical protein